LADKTLTEEVVRQSKRAAIIAEFLGTTFLVAAVVGSGIMGERLADGNSAIALLANSVATGAMLVVLIATLGHISGAHFNPIVTLAAYHSNRASEHPGSMELSGSPAGRSADGYSDCESDVRSIASIFLSTRSNRYGTTLQ
jgi:lipid-binding SYLF domain-containing protein